MNAVFLLYSYAPHQKQAIEALLECQEELNIHAFHFQTHQPVPKDHSRFFSYSAFDFSERELLEIILNTNPNILVVSGWFIKKYVWISKKIKKRGIPCVAYSDTQWRATWKQHMNAAISRWHLKKAFSHLWVAGIYQYEYARKLGYKKQNILFNSICCNYSLFNDTLSRKIESRPKNFLFVGRFIPEKGLGYLLDSWNSISDKKGWTLTLVGDGELPKGIANDDTVIIKEFKDQKEVKIEMDMAGCFVLTSIFEQWGVVLHEAALAGLPIICTEDCGSHPHFLIHGYNGYKIKSKDFAGIARAMKKIISMDYQEILMMSHRSRELGQTITPEKLAANLLSIIKE